MPTTDLPSTAPAEPLAILAEVAGIATSDLALRPLLQRITDLLAERFGWELVCLARVEAEQGAFVCDALTSRLPAALQVGHRRELAGAVGQVAACGRPRVVDDLRSCPELVPALPDARSAVCLPVRHRDQVVGLLNAESLSTAEFRDRLPLLEAVAVQIAGAIANARTYEGLRLRVAAFEVLNHVTRLATRTADVYSCLHGIAEYVRERFDLPVAAVVVSDEKRREWAHRAIASRTTGLESSRAYWPTSIGVLGRAIRTGEPQLVLDVAADPDYISVHGDVVAELVVPLRFREEILGAMLFEAADASFFRPDTVQLFETLADQIAGAVELLVVNERLADSERQLAAAAERLASVNDELLRLTLTDGLTGVANRRCFEDRLAEEWRRAQRTGVPISLALLDVDHFKAYNDHLGHPAGDACLRRVAQLLARGLGRAGELVARWGGEEFTAILPGSEAAVAWRSLERVRRRVEAAAIPHPASPTAPVVTLSVGVASDVPGLRRLPETLLERADRALYQAKRAGRNRTEAG